MNESHNHGARGRCGTLIVCAVALQIGIVCVAFSQTNDVCRIGNVEIASTDAFVRQTDQSRMRCAITGPNYTARAYHFAVDNGKSIGSDLLINTFRASLGVELTSEKIFSLGRFASSMEFITEKRVYPEAYVSETRRIALYHYNSENQSVIAVVQSESPLAPNDIDELISFRLSAYRLSRLIPSLVGVFFIPLILVLIVKYQYWRKKIVAPIHWSIDAGIWIGVPILTSLFLLWSTFQVSDVSTASFNAVASILAYLGGLFWLSVNRPNVVLAGAESVNRSIFRTFGWTWHRMTVADIDVSDVYTAYAARWQPTSKQCGQCGTHQYVHTCAVASQGISPIEKSDSLPTEVVSSLHVKLQQTPQPGSLAPCAICGSVSTVDVSELNKVSEASRSNMVGLFFLGVGGLAAILLSSYISTLYDSNDGHFLFRWLLAIPRSLASIASDIGELVILAFLAFFVLYFITIRGLRKGRLNGVKVCPTDGFLFEDVQGKFPIEFQCPKCNQHLIPARRARLSRLGPRKSRFLYTLRSVVITSFLLACTVIVLAYQNDAVKEYVKTVRLFDLFAYGPLLSAEKHRVGTVITRNQGLRVRAGPSVNYPQIGSLDRGETVQICDASKNGWYRIATPSVRGFVSDDYVHETEQRRNIFRQDLCP